MWEPRHITSLWAFMACYRASFTFPFFFLAREGAMLGLFLPPSGALTMTWRCFTDWRRHLSNLTATMSAVCWRFALERIKQQTGRSKNIAELCRSLIATIGRTYVCWTSSTEQHGGMYIVTCLFSCHGNDCEFNHSVVCGADICVCDCFANRCSGWRWILQSSGEGEVSVI
jgi:hypothetical protein